jgi:hypothetical protein
MPVSTAAAVTDGTMYQDPERVALVERVPRQRESRRATANVRPAAPRGVSGTTTP